MDGGRGGRRVVVVVLIGLLLVGPTLAGTGVGTASAAPASHTESGGTTAVADTVTNATTVEAAPETFRVEYRVSFSEDSENVVVRLTLHEHPALGSFRVGLPDGTTVTDTHGFERAGEGDWGWSESPSTPTLTYELPVDARGDTSLRGADWAIVSSPSEGVSWTEFEDLELRRTYTTDDGYAGDGSVAVGNVTVRSFEGPNGNATVVAPTAIADRVAFEKVGAEVAELDEWMPVGGATPRTNVFVVPGDFGASGRAVGGGDVYVAPVFVERGRFGGTGLIAHEYTHTRQHFETGDGMTWFTEGSAEYFEDRYPFEHSIPSFEWYRGSVSVADQPFAGTPLSEAEATSTAAYQKGSHVLTALDVLIRERTDGESRLDDVFDRVNAHDGPVDYGDFRSMVRAEAGPGLDGWLDLHVRGRGLPPLPENASLVAPAGWTSTEAPADLYFCLEGEWRTRPSILPAGEPVPVFDATHAVTRFSGGERVENGTGACTLDALPVYSPKFGSPSTKFGDSSARQYVFENDTTVTFRSAYDSADVTTLELSVVDQSTPTATATPTPVPSPAESSTPASSDSVTATPTIAGSVTDTERQSPTEGEAEAPALAVERRGAGVFVSRGAVSAYLGPPFFGAVAALLSTVFAATYLLLRE